MISAAVIAKPTDRCTEVNVVPNFDKARYSGTWYEQYRDIDSGSFNPPENYECVFSDFYFQAPGVNNYFEVR